MTQIGRALILFFAAAFIPGESSAAEYVIRVAGGSSNAAIDTALAEARSHRRDNPTDIVRIRLATGTYRLDKAIQLTRADSGTESAPLILEGADDGGTVISGAAILAPTTELVGGKYHENGIVRIGADRRPGMERLSNFRFGTYAERRGQALSLFQGNRHLMPARYPASGFLTGNNIAPLPTTPNAFVMTNTSIELFDGMSSEENVWIGGYFARDWDFEISRIEGRDAATSGMVLDKPSPLLSKRDNFRAYFLNTEKGLDVPGSYVADKFGNLRIRPYNENEPIEMGETKNVLVVSQAQYIELTKIAFEKSLESIVKFESSSNIKLNNCFIGNGGYDAAIILGSKNVSIERCVVSHLPSGGISIFSGDRKSLTPAHVAVRDNIISDFNFMTRTYKPAVALNGVGNSVEGCLISGSPHVALMFGGNNHRITGNEFFDLVTETDDASVVYAGRDWTQRGTVIERNYIHDISSETMKASSSIGIYLDDQFSGTTIRGNLIVGVGTGVLIGGGRDNHVDENLFVEPRLAAIHFDDRGMTWQKAWGNNTTLMQNFQKVDVGAPPWRAAYPELYAMPQEEPGAPRGNTASNNVVSGKELVVYASPGSRRYLVPTNSKIISSNIPTDADHFRDLLVKQNVPVAFDFDHRSTLEKLPFFGLSRLKKSPERKR